MSETILAVLITGLVSVVTTIITVVINGKTNRDKVASDLDKRLSVNEQKNADEIAHIKSEMNEMKADIKSHNGYAQMFAKYSASADEKFVTLFNDIAEIKQDLKEIRK